jgi:cell division protein FtsI (penicillin-binding protein 3)
MQEIAASAQPDDVSDESADMSAMFDQINSLPADDPLRRPATAAAMQQNQVADQHAAAASALAASQPPAKKGLLGLPDKVLSAFRANGDTTSVIADADPEQEQEQAQAQTAMPPRVDPAVQPRGNGAVVVDAGNRVAVPQFQGAALRSVVERATGLGLRVETLGSGLARDQMPAAGTMVPPGTEIVVRFAR